MSSIISVTAALPLNNSKMKTYHECLVAEEVDLVVLGGALTQELQAESLVPSLLRHSDKNEMR